MKNSLKKLIYINLQKSFLGRVMIREFRKKKFSDIKRKAEVIKKYQNESGIDIFIETGTYLGETIKEVKGYFKDIYSIELDNLLFKSAKRQFFSCTNIRIVEGDSTRALPEILRTINKRAIFWLDAHTSGGITAQGDKVTPIEEELLSISAHHIKNHIILIDDAESFIGENDYPTIEAVEKIAKGINIGYKIENIDNIIRIYL